MTTPAITTTAPVIKVNGQPLSELALMQLDDVRISRALRLPGRATLRFSDIGYAIAAGQIFAIGAVVEISGQGTVIFHGEVTGVEMTLERGQPEFAVIADDVAYKLTLGTKVRTFTQLSYSEVVRQIAREHGIESRVTGLTTPPHEYLLQADSDFGFLNEIADRSGSDWWIDGAKLIVQPYETGSTPITLAAEEDLHSFSVRASALHPGTATIKGWWPQTKQSVSADGTNSTSGADANLVQPYLQASNLSGVNKTVSTADMPGDQREAEDLADRLVRRWTAGAVTAKGSCASKPGMGPGGSVKIEGAGPASGTYQVSEVEHTYNRRGFETRFTAGDRRPSTLVDLLSGEQRSSFRREGLVIGVVTTVGNTAGSPGAIKVKYTSLGGAVESNWARIVTLGAGARRGMTFLPEVNDEVIVGFEGGDARRPVILGGVYNGRDVPVEFGVANGTVSKRRITSRLGHFVELADGTDPANQHIQLNLAGGNHLVRLGKDRLDATVPAGTPIAVKSGDAAIEIGNDGSITITGQKITLKSKSDVEIYGLNITAKASVKAAISATQVEVKATATGAISAGGSLSLKGAMVAVN